MNVALHPPRRGFTVAEVEAMVAAGIMDEDERVELIGGSLFRCRRKEAGMRPLRSRLIAVGGVPLQTTVKRRKRRRPGFPSILMLNRISSFSSERAA